MRHPAAGAEVRDGLGYAQGGHFERIEPEFREGFAGLRHQALALILGYDPETAVVFFAAMEADGADDLVGR